MNGNLKTALAFIGLAILIVSGGILAYCAYMTWQGSISWNVPEVKEFTVWDSASSGSEIDSPYSNGLGDVSVGQQTFDYYIQNDGNVEITVTVQSENPSGCSASWLSSGSYTVPVGTTRVQATLTLTITAPGSYSWEFRVS